MGLRHRRKLTEEEFCHDFCYGYVDCSSEPSCQNCTNSCLSQPPPIPPFISSDTDHDHSKHTKISTYLIIIFAVAAAAFFVLCCYAIYARFLSPRNRSRRRTTSSSRQQQPPQVEEEFLDEEHGPAVDHPIWYIRTTGLHQSIISAIAVCKYKRGEGLIEGTECSVCLGEFQEDESLRLLPKCNHAFHLPCIDTWLRSHTNCPMCRAPIVTNPARVLSMEPNTVDLSSLEEGESLESTGMEENIGGDGSEEQVEVESGVAMNVQPRRSVSLDSCSAAKISAVAASVEESGGNSERGAVDAKDSSSSSSYSGRTRYLQSAPGSMKRSRSFNGRHLMSWYSRGQKKPANAPVRSF